MFERITEQEKRHRFPAAPDYDTVSGELYSSPGELACFALVDTSSTVQHRRASGLSFFLGPENFMWVQGDALKTTTGRQGAVANTISLFQSHGEGIQVFVRRSAMGDWLDAGRGILNGMHLTEGALTEVNIRLAVKLPEALWLEFGGHPGWYLVINNLEKEASSPDAVIAAIRDAWGRPPVDLEIRRYAGDCLFAIADASGHATMSYFADNNEFASGTPQLPGPTVPTHIFPRSDSYDHEVPMGQVITRDEAFSMIENFVLTGKPAGLTSLSVLFEEGEHADVPNP